ncbi:hypothetical protein LX97_01235 [Nonlabens dokdonensis]|jgi:hypothetical protein|uniref:NoeA host specific nodulation protein n=2 Tax=Nonlabens dokdonensis TaxID=328515 RepID=L7W8U2_NONDD|nr:hypothetical protein [Nonlabens dokdonensis]AGC76574.1 NoeA host specific nodulation protein [Nonlabens dokdonensis DSW-6]PZX44225.1 hypothetical protein LX97_01235 [Nonlabens dokdonensis]
MNEVLKREELKTLEISIDQVCTLFFYKNRVIRGVHKQYLEQVKEMMSNGMLDELISKKLFVNTWISDLKVEGFDLVIEHEKIQYWNYPYEWSFTMLQDAAQTVIDCNKVANKYGYELFDVHAFNVVYNMSQPVYVDFGSFFKIDQRNGKAWSGYNNFYNSFYMPLYLYNKGFSDLSNSIYLHYGLFSDKDLFLLRNKFATLFGNKIASLIFKLSNSKRRLAAARYTRVIEKYGKHKHINKLLKFKKIFQNNYSVSNAAKLLKGVSKSHIDSYWKDYHNDKNPSQDARFLRIAEVIKKDLSDSNSLIELASNQGKFANYVLEQTQITQIIATDYDKNALDQIYLNNRSSDQVLPLLYDFVRPNNRTNTKVISDRINADVVMALAVTHHLILTQDITLDHIFNVLKSLSTKYVVIEFMPLGLYSGDMNNIPAVPDYYTLEWFKTTFSEYFDYMLDEKLDVNRHLFVGSIKEQ